MQCGGGYRSRERSCDAPVPEYGGRFCRNGKRRNIDIEGVEWQWEVCNLVPCPGKLIHYCLRFQVNTFRLKKIMIVYTCASTVFPNIIIRLENPKLGRN